MNTNSAQLVVPVELIEGEIIAPSEEMQLPAELVASSLAGWRAVST